MSNNLDYFEAFVWPFCEKDCLFCNEWWKWKRQFHSFEDFKEIINNNNFQKVVLTGWEPMMNPRLDEYIQYCSNKNILTGIVTAIDSRNYLEKIKTYLDSWLNELMISLEWPEKIHDYLVQESWAMRRILEVLDFLKKYNSNGKIIIHTNINKLNYKYLPHFLDIILRNFPNIFTYHLQMLEPFGSAVKHKNILFEKYWILLKPLFEKIENISDNHKIKFWRLPLCLVDSKFHKYISQTPKIYENHQDETVLAGYQEHQYINQQCDICSKNTQCDKFLEGYIQEFWTWELQAFD